jgi:hypothetical protein
MKIDVNTINRNHSLPISNIFDLSEGEKETEKTTDLTASINERNWQEVLQNRRMDQKTIPGIYQRLYTICKEHFNGTVKSETCY